MANEGYPGPQSSFGHRLEFLQLVLEKPDCFVGVLFVDVGFRWKVPYPSTQTAPDSDFGKPIEYFV